MNTKSQQKDTQELMLLEEKLRRAKEDLRRKQEDLRCINDELLPLTIVSPTRNQQSIARKLGNQHVIVTIYQDNNSDPERFYGFGGSLTARQRKLLVQLEGKNAQEVGWNDQNPENPYSEDDYDDLQNIIYGWKVPTTKEMKDKDVFHVRYVMKHLDNPA